MSEHLSSMDLEELGSGAAVPAHLEACPACARKLSFLRAEAVLLRRAAAHDAGSVDALWPGVQARVARHRRRRHVAWASAGFAAAAAMAAAVAILPQRALDDDDVPSSSAALDRAEHDYLHAIRVLESRVEVSEQHLPTAVAQKRRMARAQARAAIARSRAREPGARMRQLEGYAAYLRSMRRELEEDP
jgi:hypothetical protein